MATEIKFIDNSGKIKAMIAGNKQKALAAMGVKAVALTVKQMKSGYKDPHQNRDSQGRKVPGTHTDIRFTGELMRDVASEVGASSQDTVDVGNSLKYAPYIHEGTSKLQGRPYLKDAIEQGKDALQAVVEAALKEGMD